MSNSEYGSSGGVELTDELIERLAQEAEEGYEVERLRPRSRRGRPPIGSEAAALFQVRLEPELRGALARAAQLQRTSPSEMARRALRAYLEGAVAAAGADNQPTARTRSLRGDGSKSVEVRGVRTVLKAGLADQQALLRWADSIGARSEFPRLIRRLILETGRGVVHLGFPAGEGVAVGGWDGSVRATEPTAFIPRGLSLWELSVGKSVGKKADIDYRKRLTTVDGSPTTGCTYVGASLRRWRDRNTWARERTAEGRWAEVRAYGLDDIETWFETAPVTHAWISEELGLGPYGLRAAESWWASWASASTPGVAASLVLAGRTAFVEELQTRLEGTPQLTTVKAGSVEDVLAAVAAVGIQAATNGDPRLLARTAFIDDLQTWRALAVHPGELLLVAAAENVIVEASSESVHHVIVPVAGGIDADIELPPIDSNDAAVALKAAGIDDDRRAEELGRLARRSLVAFRRNIANKPELHVPVWAQPPVRRELRAALLAGRWQEGSDGDRSILTALSGVEYEELREGLTALAVQVDPFVASVDRSWGLVSPFDAWTLLGPYLHEDDLKRLDRVVRDVLGEFDPAVELPRDERWCASLDGKVFSFSGDLRRGLAETLALLGVHGRRIDAGGGNSGILWASHLVRDLLRRANEDATCRAWASIADLLPLLAEAAPDAFLDAVRQGLAGEHPLLAGVFTDGEDGGTFGRYSAHPGLLWALENTAWSRDHFGQTLDLLARLAEIDPGGRLSNRPFESMASIYWPLRPETSADIAGRLSVLDALRRRHGAIAWRLMLSVLPDYLRIHLPTHEPQFRDWKPARSLVKMVECLQFVTETVTRLLNDATTTDHWIALLVKLPQLPSCDRERVHETLVSRLDEGSLQAVDMPRLWEAVRSLIAHHRQFADADWSLPEEELQLLDSIGARLRPNEPVANSAWLFAEYSPDLGERRPGDDVHQHEAELAQRRRDAMGEILRVGGLGDARLLAKASPVPWSVGVAIADATADEHEGELLALMEADDHADIEVAHAYAARRFGRVGWAWIERLTDENLPLSVNQKALLLIATRDYPRAWEVAEGLGKSVEIEFWKRFMPYGLGGDFPHAHLAAQRLLGVGRHGAVLRLLGLYARRDAPEVSAELIAQSLEAVLASRPGDSEFDRLSQSDFEILFRLLDEHVDRLGWERIARLQWSFLPVLGLEPRVPVLHRLLSRDPTFFVDLLSRVYRRRGAAADSEESPELIRTARNGYRLLSSWSTLPGLREDGMVDEQALRVWICAVLKKLDKEGRREVGESHIGQVLARAPADSDGQWPAAAVRDVLEELQNGRIEGGFIAQIINSRDVTIRSLEEGGTQERKLVAKYNQQADDFSDEWPRTAAILRAIAESYEYESRREENSAERFRSGHER
jgi:hypothetical protein